MKGFVKPIRRDVCRAYKQLILVRRNLKLFIFTMSTRGTTSYFERLTHLKTASVTHPFWIWLCRGRSLGYVRYIRCAGRLCRSIIFAVTSCQNLQISWSRNLAIADAQQLTQLPLSTAGFSISVGNHESEHPCKLRRVSRANAFSIQTSIGSPVRQAFVVVAQPNPMKERPNP